MSIITITTEWDAFVAELLAYAEGRPDVPLSQLFDSERGQPIFALVGALSSNVSIRLVPDQDLRNRFEKLRARRPLPEGHQLTIGDRCVLNSGGPVMIVIDGDEDSVVAAWRVGPKYEVHAFGRAAVRRVVK